MKITDSKTLLQFIFDQMEKLQNKEIDCNQAHVQAKLAKEANNVLNYELKRADLVLRIKSAGIVLETPEEKKELGMGCDNPYSILNQINEENR